MKVPELVSGIFIGGFPKENKSNLVRAPGLRQQKPGFDAEVCASICKSSP
jgi:hypothetical protein